MTIFTNTLKNKRPNYLILLLMCLRSAGAMCILSNLLTKDGKGLVAEHMDLRAGITHSCTCL